MTVSCANCERRRAGEPTLDGMSPIEAPLPDQMSWVIRTLYSCGCGALWEVGHEQHHFRDEELIRVWERDAEYARVLYGEALPQPSEVNALFAGLPEDTDRIRLWNLVRHWARTQPAQLDALLAGETPPLVKRTVEQVLDAIRRGET